MMRNNTTAAAIIGIAGKYPRAQSPSQLWEHILSGTDLAEMGASSHPGFIPRHYSIRGVEVFDSEFFGYSPNDAALMDPQHRLLLTCVYRALEDAGYEHWPSHVRVGVFASSSFNGYLPYVLLPNLRQAVGEINYSALIGNEKDFLASKIAYKLNFKGPAIGLQCACSSSLVALHYACQSLLSRDCDIAVVCAASLTIPQRGGYVHKEGGPLSPDGICRPFDKDANGTVPGDACSVTILKRFPEALSDNDRIYAVVTGTAVNNDGCDKIGFTAPSISGQRAVIEEALSYAGISPDEVDYLEAHGTGTVLGDRIELTALSKVFGGRSRRLPVGSVKGNIGHTDVAAGVTSVLKSIFMLRSGFVPPIANFREHDYDPSGTDSRFDFPTEVRSSRLRHIGVSSFGIGGTNSHAIISACPQPLINDRIYLPYYLIPIYLNKISDYFQYCQNIVKALDGEVEFLDFAATMAVGRRRRAIALCFVARDREDFLRQLTSTDPTTRSGTAGSLVFAIQELRDLENCLPSFAGFFQRSSDESLADDARYMTAFSAFLDRLMVSDTATGVPPSPSALLHPSSHESLPSQASGANCEPGATLLSQQDALKKFLTHLSDALMVSSLDLSFLYSGTGWKRAALPSYPLTEKAIWHGHDAEACLVFPSDAAVSNPRRDPTDVLAHVLRTWADAVGHADLSPDATYAETGGDSLAAMDIIDALEKAYAVRISARDILGKLTPRQLAYRILNNEDSDFAESASYIRRAEDPSANTIFIIHPAGGSTFCYSAMNRFLSTDCNICVIDLPDDYRKYTSLDSLAAHYLDIIVRHQPTGPYCVGGYSFGGNVAYEIAGQMRQRDFEAGSIFMFDSHPPEAYEESVPRTINYEPIFSKVIFEYPDFSPLLSRARPLDIRDFCERWSFCFRLLKTYQPRHIVHSTCHLFCATRHERRDVLLDLNMREIDKNAWQRYFGKDLHIVAVDGDHYSIFGKSFHLRSLAKHFESQILQPNAGS